MSYKLDCKDISTVRHGDYTQEGWEHASRWCEQLAFREYHGYTSCPDDCNWYVPKPTVDKNRLKEGK